MSRCQYDGNFKLSAVQLAQSSDKSLAEIARSLGIHDSMLRRWRNQVRKEGKSVFSKTGRCERSEVEQIRRENRQLKRELEVLKKTLPLLEDLKK